MDRLPDQRLFVALGVKPQVLSKMSFVYSSPLMRRLRTWSPVSPAGSALEVTAWEPLTEDGKGRARS